jgi:hypothetical protein
MGEQVDQGAAACERALDAPWTDDGSGGGHHGIRRIAGLARRLGSEQRCVADEVHFRGDGDVEHCPIVFARDLVDQRQGEIGFQRPHGEIEHGVAVHTGHLGVRIHRRGA